MDRLRAGRHERHSDRVLVCSIGGGLLLLVYALYRNDPVFIAGQAFGVFVYLRNLQMILRGFGRRARRAPR